MPSQPAPRQTSRTTPARLADRSSRDRATIDAILDATSVCHVGYVVDDEPVVIPTLFARVGDSVVLHGSTGATVARGAWTAGDGR